MKRMTVVRPTTHYDEGIKHIEEEICELVKQRKDVSNNNPGVPPFEYITNWADKLELNEELLKSLFISLWNEKNYIKLIEPEGFQRNLSVLKSIEVGNRLFSVITIRQYSNASIVDFNVDSMEWDMTCDLPDRQCRHTHFELFINESYNCQMSNGTGGNGHFHFNFIVSPSLPDNISGIDLIFKEKECSQPFEDNQIGKEIIIRL